LSGRGGVFGLEAARLTPVEEEKEEGRLTMPLRALKSLVLLELGEVVETGEEPVEEESECERKAIRNDGWES